MTDPTVPQPGPDTPTYGGEAVLREKPSYETFTPALTPTYCGTGIRHRAITRLQGTFHGYGHQPSLDQWNALSAIPGTIEAMADGSCPPSYFLSSLDPGIGKTQTLIQTIKEIVSAKRYDNAKYEGKEREGDEYEHDLVPKFPDVGIVVFLSRRREIENLVEEGGFDPSTFAVLVQKGHPLNQRGLGSDRVNEAQILFMTQQRLETATIHGSKFADCSAFFYRGKPRQVRVWDESLVPGRHIVIERRAISALLDPLHKRHPELSDDLDIICDTLRGLSDGEIYEVPDFVEKHGISELTAKGVLPTFFDHRAETIQSLWFLSGRKVGVRREGKNNLFIDYQNFLPDDLAPLLILDASGRVRTTYEFWKDRRGGLEVLPTGYKRYDNLTINVWKQSGSKSGWKKDAAKLIEGLVAMIATDPDAIWLIVHHLPKSVGVDLPKLLKAHPAINPDRVKFLTWGQHYAVNTFKDVPNVILAGNLFYTSSTIEALGMAAAKHPASNGPLSKEDRDRVELGEYSHDILQALCRGKVRGCVDGVCPPSKAFIIAHPSSGIPSALGDIFPGATVREWKQPRKPTEAPAASLKGKTKAAFDYISAQLAEKPGQVVAFTSIGQAIGMDLKNLRQLRKHTGFGEAVAAAGYIETTSAPKGFRLSA